MSINPNIDTKATTLLRRVEKVELAGAQGAPDLDARMNTTRLVKECFEWIRTDPPRAYIRLTKAALNVPSSAKPDYITRCALFGRLAGYTLMFSMQSEDIFNRVMAVNERPAG